MAENNLGKIPKFLKRLFRESCDPENTYIMWSEEGERIQIINKELFIKNTLPILSKTKEYSAFVRQLNNYGFVKVRGEKSDEGEEYYNPFFKRDQPGLMAFIKRVSKANKTETQLSWSTIENSITYLTNSNYRLSNEIIHLKERIDKQDQTINGLLDILGRVFRTGIQNISIDTPYNKQHVDKFFNYSSEPTSNKLRDIEPVTAIRPSSKNILPKSEDVKKDRDFPDMSDIFF